MDRVDGRSDHGRRDFARDDRRSDHRRRDFDRDDRRFRHHRFFFIHTPYYYPYYYPCGYSYDYPYSYGYHFRHYYPPRYCPPPYGYDYGYRRPYDYGSGYGYGYGSGSGYGGGGSDQYGDQGNGQYGASSPTVILRGIAFNPARLTVKAGQDVVWSWDDGGVTHTATADDGSFDSGRMTSGTYRHTFDHPGEFRYHCQIHPQQMMGTVVVTQ
jgi:plastocyanin